MSNFDGGPAFPVPEVFDERRGETTQYGSTGMSLRDYFAGKYIEGYMASHGDGFPTREQAAREAYLMADAMLKARSVR